MTVPLGKKFIGGDPPLVSSVDESEGGGEKKSKPLLVAQKHIVSCPSEQTT